MSRFYVPPENINATKSEILIGREQGHHIIDVLRMKESDKVLVFDGTGNEYTGFIKKINNRAKTLVVGIVKRETPAAERFPEIHLAQAIPRKHKMSYIVEKATELGVAHIIPLITARTMVRPDDAACERKVSRWKSIATQAAQQCGRTEVPLVSGITRYEDVLDTLDQYDIALLACMSEKAVPIKRSLSGFKTGRIMVIIGPEGDFTLEELNKAHKDNCKFVSLGKRVLKSDTAGLFVLSVLGYEFSA